MRGCFHPKRPGRLSIWGSHGVRTSSWRRPQQAVVKHLTNVELLDLVKQSKKDITAASSARSEAYDFEAQGADAQSQDTLSCPLQLPQSPLIDARLVDARIRHRIEKPRPSKDKSPFRSKLEKNPYARALSSPPRVCLVTSLHLPSHFQIPFGLATHPKTGALWHLPRLSIELTPRSNTAPDQDRGDNESKELVKQVSPANSPLRVVSGTHFLGSRHVIKYVSAMHDKFYRKLMPHRWKEDSSINTQEIVWREDMDSFILEILRKSVATKLAYLASRSAAYIAACRGYENNSEFNQVAAVLWLGLGGEEMDQNPPPDGAKSPGPPPYSMHYYRSHYIPCYNLPTLLGHVHLRDLRLSKSSHFGGQYAVIKLKRGTVNMQLELWKLLGYLANDEEEQGSTNTVGKEEVSEESGLENGEESVKKGAEEEL